MVLVVPLEQILFSQPRHLNSSGIGTVLLESGEVAGPPIDLPLGLGKEKLQLILNALLNKEETLPYSFFVDEKEVTTSLAAVVESEKVEEKVLTILYQPKQYSKLELLQGHAEAVLCASFSPDGRHMASGSGDTTVRFWDINTETPHFTCKGHRHWVLVTAWSPDGERLASACKGGHIIIWDPTTGKQVGRTLLGHKQWVTSLCWEPLHLTSNGQSGRMASADSFKPHKKCDCVTMEWRGLIYSASQDRTIKVWRAADGVMCRTLQGHGHWVNTLALNTDYALRTGASDPRALMKARPEYVTAENRQEAAEKRYKEALTTAGG
ncbi:hypothetical protein C7M84_006755 [Penaeus vannamei]|uniref:NLE domain-containing protein n=1 Tax=Penaeus vannamei TaxID=6689 RepID=A0A3R7M727_PENVA|nr:hypothetical protein C7M84_006755 [Penaeus vannamei]